MIFLVVCLNYKGINTKVILLELIQVITTIYSDYIICMFLASMLLFLEF